LLNKFAIFSDKLNLIFRIIIPVILVLFILYCFIERALIKPDFSKFDTSVTKIELRSMVSVNDSLKKMKSISITNPEIIKVFCENLKSSSKIKHFENSHANDWYYIKVFRKNKVLNIEMGTTFKYEFIIMINGNFNTTGITRKYSNTKISKFISQYINPVFEDDK